MAAEADFPASIPRVSAVLEAGPEDGMVWRFEWLGVTCFHGWVALPALVMRGDRYLLLVERQDNEDDNDDQEVGSDE